jgi:hypothetical protein
MSSDRATTVVFPLPMEWLSALTGAPGPQHASKQEADSEASERPA